MNKFISEGDIKAEHDKLASLSKTELEWERVRSNGPGYNTATHGSKPGASLYDQLKAREEESAMQEEEQQKGLGLPKAMDEDEVKYFDEQRQKEKEEQRRLQQQLENFKKASALAATTTNQDAPIIPMIAKKPATNNSTIKRITPIAKVTPVKKSDEPSTSPESSKKRSSSADITEDSPSTKKIKLAEASDVQPVPSKPLLVKYRRDDDE